MKKNMNENFEITVDEMTEIFGDTPVEMSFREVKEGMDSFFGLMGLTVELVNLIRKEDELKKHHRAYLHVREAIDDKVKETRRIMTKVSVDMLALPFVVDVAECAQCDEYTPFADTEDAESVSLPKEEYDLMIDDLLTMSEIIQCVADMRTQDAKAICEFGKFVPAFAAYEKNRLSLYREAAKEAEEIFDRWADRVDEEDEDDYEPDEYFSD